MVSQKCISHTCQLTKFYTENHSTNINSFIGEIFIYICDMFFVNRCETFLVEILIFGGCLSRCDQ